MLVPLTRKTFNTLIPVMATGAQYAYAWGKLPDFLRRLLISVVGVLVIVLFDFGHQYDWIRLVVGLVIGLYWLWGPVLWASLRNRQYRQFPHSGLWQGEVLDLFVTEEVVGEEETVNKRGDLVIVKNRERRLNLEIGDETGFTTRMQVPLKKGHQAIRLGDLAEMLVLSYREDLGRIGLASDIYLPESNLWVSDYPVVQREAFMEISKRMRDRWGDQRELSPPPPPRRQPIPDEYDDELEPPQPRPKRIPKTGIQVDYGLPPARDRNRSRLSPRDRSSH
jgi:hypothetical protein